MNLKIIVINISTVLSVCYKTMNISPDYIYNSNDIIVYFWKSKTILSLKQFIK